MIDLEEQQHLELISACNEIIKPKMLRHYKAHLVEKLVYNGVGYLFDYDNWNYYNEDGKIYPVEDTELIEELNQAYQEYKKTK